VREHLRAVSEDLYFGRVKLGRFHEPLRRIEDEQGRLARKRVKV
jgi:hypothetical protein